MEDEVGVRTIMEDLLTASHNADPKICTAAVTILHAFCKQTELDFTEYVPQLLRGLIHLFTRTDDAILLAAWNCLDAVTKVNTVDLQMYWYTQTCWTCAVVAFRNVEFIQFYR